jgi:hypothetical protein
LEPEKVTTVAGVLFRTLHVYPKGNAGLPGLTVATTGRGARERSNIISDLRQNAAQSRSYRALVNHDRELRFSELLEVGATISGRLSGMLALRETRRKGTIHVQYPKQAGYPSNASTVLPLYLSRSTG